MSNFANVLPPSNNLPLSDNEPSELSGQDDGGSFDDVMSQALNPPPPKFNSSPSSRHTTYGGFQPLNQNQPEEDQAANNASPAPVTSKSDSSESESASASAKSASSGKETAAKDAKNDVNQTGMDPDNSPTPPIQFLTPTLSAFLLSPAPAATTAKSGSTSSGSKDSTNAIGDSMTGGHTVAGQPVVTTKKGSTAASSATAPTATDSAKKGAVSLKDLGLSAVPPENTPAKTDKIAGENLTTAKIDPVLENAEKPVNAGKSTKNGAQVAGISAGTPVADADSPMKKADTTNKVTGQTEKVLPGDNSSVRVSNLLRIGSVSASSFDQPAATNIIPISSALDRATSAANLPEPVAVTNLSDIQARAMERTHELVTMNALRLVNTQSDTMSVVLKPGAGTELSLELRQRGDIIEAQAVLQHGDYDRLSQHWPDLQQRLEQKGIKLGALGTDESSLAFGGQQGRSQNQSSPEQDSLFASAFAEFSLAGPVTGISAPAAAAGGRGSWESWA